MMEKSNLDTRLSRFLLDEAPSRAPERLIDASRRRVARTRQRRRLEAFGVRSWRAFLTPAGAVTAAILIGFLSAALLFTRGPDQPSVGTQPSASATPSPCPTRQGTCRGLLEPGTYTSTSFLPAVRYTVSGGWANVLDSRGQLDLSYATGGDYTYPDGLRFHDGISIFRRPIAESTTAMTPEAGVDPSARGLAQWLVAHADLDASAPVPVTIGGVNGYRLVLSLPSGARTAPDHCTTDHREPRCASLFISSDPAATYGFGLVGPEVAVVYLLDLPSGDTVMVVIDDVDGIDQPGLDAAAMPIVNSMTFLP